MLVRINFALSDFAECTLKLRGLELCQKPNLKRSIRLENCISEICIRIFNEFFPAESFSPFISRTKDSVDTYTTKSKRSACNGASKWNIRNREIGAKKCFFFLLGFWTTRKTCAFLSIIVQKAYGSVCLILFTIVFHRHCQNDACMSRMSRM